MAVMTGRQRRLRLASIPFVCLLSGAFSLPAQRPGRPQERGNRRPGPQASEDRPSRVPARGPGPGDPRHRHPRGRDRHRGSRGLGRSRPKHRRPRRGRPHRRSPVAVRGHEGGRKARQRPADGAHHLCPEGSRRHTAGRHPRASPGGVASVSTGGLPRQGRRHRHGRGDARSERCGGRRAGDVRSAALG